MLEQCKKKCLLAVINGAQKSLYRKIFQHLQILLLDISLRWTLLIQPKFMASTMICHSRRKKLKFQPSGGLITPIHNSFGLNVGSSTENLVETLLDKTHHICHYENLKFYLKHGLRVKKLHKVVEFQQSQWLGAYIAKNTTMR